MEDNATNLTASFERTARKAGADLFGVADITCLQEYLCSKGGEFLRDFPRAISIGVAHAQGSVDQLVQHHNPISQWAWRWSDFRFVTPTLDRASFALARGLEAAGFRSHAICYYGSKELQVPWAYPLKLTGYLAGLGWIGKNSLLISPKWGPRFRLAVVLTDAPLTLGSPLPVRCGKCTDCIEICPSKALGTGAFFDPSNPREDWRHGDLCNAYVNQRAVDLPFPDRMAACALCLYACPVGKRKNKKKGSGE